MREGVGGGKENKRRDKEAGKEKWDGESLSRGEVPQEGNKDGGHAPARPTGAAQVQEVWTPSSAHIDSGE